MDLFKDKIGKNIKLFLKNNKKFEGKILSVSEQFIVIDDRIVGEKGIAISEITDYNVEGDAQ